MTEPSVGLKLALDNELAASNLREFEVAFKKAMLDLGRSEADIAQFRKLSRDVRQGKTDIDGLQVEFRELYQLYEQGRELAKDRSILGLQPHKEIHAEIEKVRGAYERLKASGTLSQEELAQAALRTEKRIQDLQRSTNGWVETLGDAKAALAGVAASGAALVAVANKAIDFESAMADVAKVVDGTDEQVASLANEIKGLSNELAMAPVELAKIAAAGGQMGIPIDNMKQFIVVASQMSTAFNMSAEQAGDSIATLMNVFGIGLDQVSSLGDAINTLGNTTAAKESDIITFLARVGGTASQFGLAADQAAALGAALISLGKSPEVAATGVNALLSKLQTANVQGDKFKEALQSMGLSADKLAADIRANPQEALNEFLTTLQKLDGQARAEILVKLFGTEYQDDISALVGSLDQYQGALGLIADKARIAGAMQEEFRKRNETTEAQLAKLSATVDTLAINLGTLLLPAVNAVASGLSGGADALATFADKFPLITAFVGALAVAAGSAAALRLALKSMGVVGAQAMTSLRGQMGLLQSQMTTTTVAANRLSIATNGLFAGLLGWELGSWAYEEFGAVRKFGVLMAADIELALMNMQFAWESFKAVFTDDTVEAAAERYQKRFELAQQTFKEMWKDAEKSPEQWRQESEKAVQTQEQLTAAAQAGADALEKLGVASGGAAGAVHQVGEASSGASGSLSVQLVGAMEQAGVALTRLTSDASQTSTEAGASLSKLAQLIDEGLKANLTDAAGASRVMADAYIESFKKLAGDPSLEKFATQLHEMYVAGKVSAEDYARASAVASESLATTWLADLSKVSNAAEFKQAQAELERMRDLGVVSAEDFRTAWIQGLQDTANAVAGVSQDVQDAFSRMGVQTSASLTAAAKQAQTDFDTIKQSGQASGEALAAAYKKYADAAAAANNGVVPAAIAAQAATYGVKTALDEVARAGESAGDSVVDGMNRAGNAAADAANWMDEAWQGSSQRVAGAAAAIADAMNGAMSEMKSLGAEAYNRFAELQGLTARMATSEREGLQMNIQSAQNELDQIEKQKQKNSLNDFTGVTSEITRIRENKTRAELEFYMSELKKLKNKESEQEKRDTPYRPATERQTFEPATSQQAPQRPAQPVGVVQLNIGDKKEKFEFANDAEARRFLDIMQRASSTLATY